MQNCPNDRKSKERFILQFERKEGRLESRHNSHVSGSCASFDPETGKRLAIHPPTHVDEAYISRLKLLTTAPYCMMDMHLFSKMIIGRA